MSNPNISDANTSDTNTADAGATESSPAESFKDIFSEYEHSHRRKAEPGSQRR
jgi:hypothetical protein